MRLPDWLIYTGILLAFLFILGRVTESADAPPALAPASPDGKERIELPAASPFDPPVIVEVGPQSSNLGTAFSVNRAGYWLTARHVVDGCEQVAIVGAGQLASRAVWVRVAQDADLALVKTERASPVSLRLAQNDDFRRGDTGFHIGYPQGQPGEVASRLMQRERLVASGRFSFDAPVIAWAEIGRTRGLFGTLSGISGGPVFAPDGRVIGVTVAESLRRGRVYTAPPSAILGLLSREGIAPGKDDPGDFSISNYGTEADELRRSMAVAKVMCIAK